MIKPHLSPVAPRVWASDNTSPVLLTDKLESLLKSEYPIRVRVDGEHSPSALAHVAEHLKSEVQSGKLRIQGMPAAKGNPIVRLCYAINLSPGPATLLDLQFDLTFELVPWSRDDFIEYLLNRHPQQCRSVMERLQNFDLSFAGGSPAVWQLILRRMAKDESQTDLEEIVVEEVRSWFDDDAAFDSLADVLIVPVGDRQFGVFGHPGGAPLHGQQVTVPTDLVVAQLLHNPDVRHVVALKRFQQRLKSADEQELERLLCVPLDAIPTASNHAHPLVPLGREIAGDPMICEKLSDLSANRPVAAASCSTLLAQADPTWRPQGEGLELRGAYLAEVQWSGIEIPKSDLRKVDLSGADLSQANLRDSQISMTNFANCNLKGADLSEWPNSSPPENPEAEERSDEKRSRRARSKRRRARRRKKKLQAASASIPSAGLRVSFTGCDLTEANLSGRVFVDASFRNASLCRIDGGFLRLVNADLHSANLTGGKFTKSRFQMIDFSSATLDGCAFRRAEFNNATFSGVRASTVDFAHAKIAGCEWTGSQLRGCSFRGAVLANAKVAEISWENCDLRDADLRGWDLHLGSTRSGLVDSPYPSHGTRTGFYTDDYVDQHFKRPEEIRKASLFGCDLRGANIRGVDFYLVDLRSAKFDEEQRQQLISCGAILDHDQM